MFSRTILSCSLVALVAFSGCGKKKSAPATSDAEFAKTPQVTESAASGSSKDIFDEFYTDDSSKSKANAKKGAPEASKLAPVSGGEFSSDGQYVVQISSTRIKEMADHLVDKLKSSGYPAYIAEVENPTPSLLGTCYRVRIGGFAGVSGARAFSENTLVPTGYEYWIDNKSNDNVGVEGSGLGSSDQSGGYQEAAPAPAPAAAPYSEPAPAAAASYSEPAPAPALASEPAPYSSEPAPASAPVEPAPSAAPAESTPAPAPAAEPATTTPASSPSGTTGAGSGWSSDTTSSGW